MTLKRVLSACLVIAGLAVWTSALSAPISVDIFAMGNSSTGGVDLDTGLDLVAGDRLVSTVDPGDCWSAGAANRNSNANGLDGESPVPCQPTGDFGLHSQDGESFPFGALVGRIGAGDWFLLGTSFDAVVAATGRLFLVYWDSNNGDNTEFVTATIDVNPLAVPTPGSPLLLGIALIALGASRRRRA
jgi:hypothetical protein